MSAPLIRIEEVDKRGIEKFLTVVDYKRSFGGSISVYLQPFSTNTGTGVFAHYQKSIFSSGATITGLLPNQFTFNGADSSGLNPFGPQTLNQGIISGSGRTDDLDLNLLPDDVRTYGFKNPTQLVGWGFDIFGQPSPNSNTSWNISGIFSSTGPNNTYKGSGSVTYDHGKNVPYDFWNAGPSDMRWDLNRKVWTGPNSVYSAYILKAYLSGVEYTDTDSQLSSALTYDAMIYDGLANRMTITGISHIGPKPIDDAYKVQALTSGTFCFIVHANLNGRPGYSIFAVEQPGLFDCSTSSSSGSNLLDDGEGPVNEVFTLSDLIGSPLLTTYGGTGHNDIASGYILVGNLNGNGTFDVYQLNAGSGVLISVTGSDIIFQLSPDVGVVTSGINTSIKELAGLTTPLSLGQGGTGASGKNFVDLTTSQTVSGNKYFSSQLQINSGSFGSPGLAFGNDPNTGLYAASGIFGISTSGTKVFESNGASGVFLKDIYFKNPYNCFSNVYNIISNSGNNLGLYYTSTGNANIDFGSGYTGNIDVVIDANNIGTIGVNHGIITQFNSSASGLPTGGSTFTTMTYNITGHTNNLNIGSYDYLRISGIADYNLTGLTATSGKRLAIANVGSGIVTLMHQNTSSTASYRFICPFQTGLLLNPNDITDIIYDEIDQRWRI